MDDEDDDSAKVEATVSRCSMPQYLNQERHATSATAGGDEDPEEPVPEPTDCHGGTGRARWLRQRLHRLRRLQRQRSAPGPSAAHSTSVDDTVSSHIQMLNSLDSQVHVR